MEENVKKINNKILLSVSMFISLGAAVLMLISLFLPYITGGYGEMKSNSMVSYVQLAMDKGSEYMGSDAFGIMMFTMVALIGVFSALTLIFALVKKPVPIIIFTIIAALVFCILCWDFTDRGVVGDNAFSWGIAFYTFIIGAILAFGGAVFMIVQKNKIKNSGEV